MNTKTLEYSSKKSLDKFIDDNNIIDNKLLLQIFTANNSKEFILELQQNISSKLPNAKIIGSTTCGEISSDGLKTNSTIISFSSFDSTTIETNLIEHTQSSFTTGQHIAESFSDIHSDTLKLIITFTDGLNMNGEEYLNGVSSINNKIIIAGGMAGDNAKFEETFVFTENRITTNGAVAVALYNKNLEVNTNYSFNWETIGKEHIVEKSDKNRVYQIDGMTTVDFYKYYLGDDMEDLLPAIGIEFPLVMKQNHINIARAVLTKHNDGSLSFAGNIPEGSTVRFGHGDVQMIIDKGIDCVKKIIKKPIESIFIYSCMARKALLLDDINIELAPLKELAPISGFFTYGEFYSDCDQNNCTPKLLNQTMTSITLSEKKELIKNISHKIFNNPHKSKENSEFHRTQALSILIERTTKELEDLNNQLENRVKKEVNDNLEKDSMIQVMQTQSELGEMIVMIIHQWRQPLSAITTSASAIQVYNDLDTLTTETINKSMSDILSYAEHLNSTIEDFRDLFKANNKLQVISLSKLINKSLSIVSPIVKKNNIKVITEFNNDTKILIQIGLVMQVLVNICKNAVDILIENNVENPTIKIITKIEKEMCIIRIFDNGGGIPNDIFPFIFDKKFTTKGETHGTGIGLHMSKTIIENKMGGKLTASNENGWAVFNLEIPIIEIED